LENKLRREAQEDAEQQKELELRKEAWAKEQEIKDEQVESYQFMQVTKS